MGMTGQTIGLPGEGNRSVWITSFYAVVLGVMMLCGIAEAGPGIRFLPESVGFDTVSVGETQELTLFAYNPGDTTLLVRGLSVTGGGPFSVRDSVFVLAAGDSAGVTVSFSPVTSGVQAGVLSVSNNSPLETVLVSLFGAGAGPEISVSADRLVFASPGIGRAVSAELTLSNNGSDTLRFSEIRASDSLFVVGEASLVLAPDSSHVLVVTHTPVATGARIDTLILVTNDYDEAVNKVFLDVIGTPRDLAVARLGMVRVDSVAYPSVGDTVSVELILKTSEDVVESVEVFFGFDAGILQPLDTDAPVVASGFSDGGTFLVNRYFPDEGTHRGIAQFSIPIQVGARTQGTLARIDLVVSGPIPSLTLLTALNEEPALNSTHLTASQETLALVPENRLVLGNSPPVVKPFPLVTASEDRSRSIALKGYASDEETSVNDLAWKFVDGDSQVVVSVTMLDSSIGPIARFFPPRNGSGAFSVRAIVTDEAGGQDSTVIVMQVAQVEDPPGEPQIKLPADGADGLVMPVNFEWEGTDPDPDDVVTYDFLLGMTDSTLEVSANGLTMPAHAVSGLAGGADFFWQVLATDRSGNQTPGAIRKFSTAMDQTSPVLASGPDVVTPPTTTSVDLSWQTDEPTRSTVRFGPLAGFSNSGDVREKVLEDLVTLSTTSLTDLMPNTEYAYQVTHTDEAGNATLSEIKTFFTLAEEVPSIPGDLNEDGFVNFTDFIRFAQVFGTSVADEGFLPAADFSGNGEIAFDDFVRFSALYSQAGGI